VPLPRDQRCLKREVINADTDKNSEAGDLETGTQQQIVCPRVDLGISRTASEASCGSNALQVSWHAASNSEPFFSGPVLDRCLLVPSPHSGDGSTRRAARILPPMTHTGPAMGYSDYKCFRFGFDSGVTFVSIDHPPINLLDEVLVTGIRSTRQGARGR
jgi:hypothetical protein